MANEEHLRKILSGIEIWNNWRDSNLGTSFLGADLYEADLSGRNLNGINLSGADLRKANLSGAKLVNAYLADVNLSGADLTKANLNGARLTGAVAKEAVLNKVNLSNADLSGVNLNGTELKNADLSAANLINANLCEANLNGANLTTAILTNAKFNKADLIGAVLTRTEMQRTDLSHATCGGTVFASLDLSNVIGLDTVRHLTGSTIGIDVLYGSQGKIPEKFLRGCGLPERFVIYIPSLLEQAIQFYSCFISYSHKDRNFAGLLHDRLQGEGIRCWLDEHQLNPGDPLHPTIYEAIRVYDKTILCCSETALTSWWVEKEFTRGMKKEEDYQLPLIIPLNLDGYVFDPACTGWVADEIRSRVVGDFTGWKDHDRFEAGLQAVMKSLRTEDSKPPAPTPKLKRK